MREKYHRSQILLEPEQHRLLADLARQQGRSISDVTRELLRLGLEQFQREKSSRLEALERLKEIRQKQPPSPPTLLQDVRREWEDEMENWLLENRS